MNLPTILLILLFAALLEAGGDALIRYGLRAGDGLVRTACFGIGALVLFTYGYVVNAPSWDFGRLLGVYVVFFFLVAQLLAWLVFHEQPSSSILIGGALIVLGGLVISTRII